MRFHSSATPKLMDFLGRQRIPWEVLQSGSDGTRTRGLLRDRSESDN